MSTDHQDAVEQIRERVRLARRRTREGLGAAGQAMREVRDAAAGTIAVRLDEAGAQSSTNLMTALHRHETLVRAYVSSMRESADSQSVLAREASTHTAAIARAGQQMARASKSSQLVAMNALISSARLGDSGGALAVLANEMQELAGRVRKTAGEVAELANELSNLLPRIESNVSAVKERTGVFLSDVEERIAEVHDGAVGLQQALHSMDGAAGAANQEVGRHADLGAEAMRWGPAVERCLDDLDEVADALDSLGSPAHAAA